MTFTVKSYQAIQSMKRISKKEREVNNLKRTFNEWRDTVVGAIFKLEDIDKRVTKLEEKDIQRLLQVVEEFPI